MWVWAATPAFIRYCYREGYAMAVLQDRCVRERYDGDVEEKEVGYTGVDPDGETRECPMCLGRVALRPGEEDEVIHLTGRTG